jgi:hypothetical protein
MKKLLAVCFAVLAFGAPQVSLATAIANSNLSAFNLQVTPQAGTAELTFDWELEAFAEAQNSLGEFDQDFDFSFFGGNVSADAQVTWAEGHGDATAPIVFPPNFSVVENASSSVNLPGCDPKAASSLGRGTLLNEFIITGGTGTVDVDFSVDLSGGLFVFTDECGILAETEVIFGLELDGDLILDYQKLLSIGPNDSDSFTVSELLSTTVPLEFDVPYFLYLEVDSESEGIVDVPEPHTLALLLVGLGGFVGVSRKRARHPRR